MIEGKKPLTRRQQIVFNLYQKGFTQKQIAEMVGERYQATIAHIIQQIKVKGYDSQIEIFKALVTTKRTPLTDKWLQAEVESNKEV